MIRNEVHVVRNQKGKVVATFEAASRCSLKLEPSPQKGHRVEQVDVDERYVENLKAFYKKHAK